MTLDDIPLGMSPKVSGLLNSLRKRSGISGELPGIIAQNRLPGRKAH